MIGRFTNLGIYRELLRPMISIGSPLPEYWLWPVMSGTVGAIQSLRWELVLPWPL